jgi:N4-gp56 family major capsid protein
MPAVSSSSVTTASAQLAHAKAIHYRKEALDRLVQKNRFHEVCDKDQLELQNGRTVVWFRYGSTAALTTTTTEGSVSTAQGPFTSRQLSATLSQYSAFITLSDFVVETAIDPIVENHARLLGEQAGKTVDTITRAVIDDEYISSSSAPGQSAVATYAKVADFRKARHTLVALEVEPFMNDLFKAFVHPYVSYDLVNDPDANGLADIMKYTTPQNSPLVRYNEGKLVEVAGCQITEVTNVKVSGSNYRAYIFGKGAVGCVDLAGRGPSRITDPKKERFSINIIRPKGGELADPEGTIGAAVSYNFKTTTVVKEGPAGIGGTYRYRMIDFPSSIA